MMRWWECVYDSRYSNIFAQTRYIVRITRHPISNVSTLTYVILYEFPFFSCTLSCRKTLRKQNKSDRKREREVEKESEWTDGRGKRDTPTNAYNGCDSHKYRLVFLGHSENDKYKRRGASFFFWHIPYLRMFLLLMNILCFFIITIIFFFLRSPRRWPLFCDTDSMLNSRVPAFRAVVWDVRST